MPGADPDLPAAAATWLLLIGFGLSFMLQDSAGAGFELPLALWPLGRDGNVRLGGEVFAVGFAPWQLLSYGFLHADVLHLLLNGLGLWLFGRSVELVFGPVRFAAYVLMCIAGAGLAQLLTLALTLAPRELVPTVGASGGVFGVLFAYGYLFPHKRMPIIPIPAWLAVSLFGALELYRGLTRPDSSVAHFAHLGGMVIGAYVCRHWQRAGVIRRFEPERTDD